jgi:hypothetical protein
MAIIEEYDRKSLFPMPLKSYHHLHPFFEVERSLAYKIDENKSLDIFEMVANTNELAKKLVNQALFIFHKY